MRSFTWHRNDFHSTTSSFHPYTFLCICLHDTETKFRSRTSHSGMSSFRFSIRMKFSFWYDISFWYHVNWKRTPFRDETANRVVWGELRMRIVVVFDLARKENALGWTGWFCHVNAVRTSFWNETRSGMKLILVLCEQPLSYENFYQQKERKQLRSVLKYSATGVIHEKGKQLNTTAFAVVALWSKIDILI